MTELHVRNLPAETHERLRDLAATEGRSMSAQAAVLLRKALDGAVSSNRNAAVERLRSIRAGVSLPDRLPSAEDLVRADRDAGQ